MNHYCNCKICSKEGCHCVEYARFFTTLGNRSRLHIINALRTGSMNVTEICDITGEEQTLVSHNLRKLSEEGLISSERDGKYVVYTIMDSTLKLMDIIDNHVKNVLEVTHE